MEALVAGAREHGDVVRFAFGPVDLTLVVSPTDIGRVLVDNAACYDKAAVGYGKLRLALGDGLLTSDGNAWRRRRRVVQPAFHQDKIRRLADVITQASISAVDRWRARPSGEVVDVSADMTALTLDIICKAMFSTDITPHIEVLGGLMTTAIEHINERMMALSSIFDFPDRLPTAANRRFEEALRTGDALVFEVIERRRTRSDDPGDLLSMLMQMRDQDTGEAMTSRELRDEIITIFAAGHETTANALAWTWLLVAMNPDVESKLHAEIDRVLGDEPPDPDDFRALTYTAAVVKESLRLYPPAWVMSRRALADDQLGGYDVPAGSAVLLSPYVTQRHAAWFPDPERFDPDRFLREPPPKFAYFPFGGGQRLCIGKELAMTEAVLVIATVAQRLRFELTPGDAPVPEPLVTLRPKSGVRLRAVRRDDHRARRKPSTSMPCESIQR
jgi:cytochrome P450